MLNTILDKAQCLLGRHIPAVSNGRWANSPSGDGFNVSECRRCGMAMTRRSGGPWRAIAIEDRA